MTRGNGKASRNATPSSNPGTGAVSSTYAIPKKKSNTSHKANKSSDSSQKKTIRVTKGDTLGEIAARYDVRGRWKRLYKLNKSRLNGPHSLRVGQKLRIR